MRRIAWTVVALAVSSVSAQLVRPSEKLEITAKDAVTWQARGENIIQLTGPIAIQTDEGQFAADDAVIWLSGVEGGLIGEQEAQIALLGHAKVVHGQSTREGDKLFVTERVRGRVALTADNRQVADASNSDLYKLALDIRPAAGIVPAPRKWQDLPVSPTAPTTQPTTRPSRRYSPVNFQATDVRQTMGADGKMAYVLTGGVLLTQVKGPEQIELRADRAVLFTQLKSLRDLQNSSQFKTPQDAVYAAYLEGDVQIVQTPSAGSKTDQRLAAERVYYEFTTDRAVLTDAVIHTIEPQRQIPIIVRADAVRQLSVGEYRASNAVLTTSSFATPSYSVNASSAYIRQYYTGDDRLGDRTVFKATHATFRSFGVPVFYLPYAAGSMTDRGSPLRELGFGNSRSKGFSLETEWGLFETLGQLPPSGLDLSYRLDYFAERGFGLGFNGEYEGGHIRETSKEAWDFSGGFKSYFLPHDTGEDNLGRNRLKIPDSGDVSHPNFRGYALWEHQHFFPQDWQIQVRAGWVSDPTFLEYWRPQQFDNGLPTDASIYLKRQRDTEALTLLLQIQVSDLVTTADGLQETTGGLGPIDAGVAKPFEIEHLPELGYRRIGDSILDDSLTFFSDNTLAGVHMNASDDTLVDYGFRNARNGGATPAVLPGIPSVGQTGFTEDWVYRGDFRQELDWPIQFDQFKVVPYVVGRYTVYSDSVDGDSLHRLFAGGGIRATTAFWKVDDSFQSKLFDINRLRHVVEPSVNLFTSAQNKDRSDIYIFDESIDDVRDVSVAQLAVMQRWQTKRGGPGNWRSVDFFTLNVEANFFTNAPDGDELPPGGFRGVFFASRPENSIPRNSINADALWRISDTTILLSDISHNLDEQELATASMGLAVQRDIRTSWYAGLRYIGQVNSTIASFAINYQLSTKYTLAFGQSYEFSEREADQSTITVIRKFDRFFVSLQFFRDYVNDDSGFRFAIYPEGLGYGFNTADLNTVFGSN
jgi:lipopolysaccharide export system protein LptA